MKLYQAVLSASLLLTPTLAIGPSPAKKVPVTTPEAFIWKDPYAKSSADARSSYEAACTATSTFTAKEYLLHDLFELPPKGLWPWADALKKVFGTREYPGGWEGRDPHGYERNVIMMEYEDVPTKVKEWIEGQENTVEGGKPKEGKGLFAVYEKPAAGKKVGEGVTAAPKTVEGASETSTAESARESGKVEFSREEDGEKVVIFSPGALYGILPLWVAEGSQCESKLTLILYLILNWGGC
jgi:hypothetical protein